MYRKILLAIFAIASASWFYAEAAHTVTCLLDYDKTLYTPLEIEAYSVGGRKAKVSGVPKMSQTTLSLEPGVYDFHVRYCSYDAAKPATAQCDLYNPYKHVILENITVDADLQLTFDVATATNLVSFKAVTPEGEPYSHVMLRVNAAGKSYFDYDDANIYTETITTSISNSEFGEIHDLNLSSTHLTWDGLDTSHSLDVYVNDVSSRYSFSQTRVALSMDNRIFAVGMSVTGLPSAPVTNADAAFTHFEQEFLTSPFYEKLRRDTYCSHIDMVAYNNNFQTIAASSDLTDATPGAWVSIADADGGADVRFVLTPVMYEMDVAGASDSDPRNQIGTTGCPVTFTGAGMTYTASHSYFTFAQSEETPVMSNGVPVTCLITHRATPTGGGSKRFLFAPTFVGRYGEMSQADLLGLEAVVTSNGTVVCDSYAKLDEWSQAWSADGHTPGTLNATFTNSTRTLDGVAGKSITELTINETASDMCPPAVQMLAITDHNGAARHLYATGESIRFSVAAGDANGNGRSFSLMDAKSVELAVARTGVADDPTAVTLKYVTGATSISAWSVYGGELTSGMPEEGLYDAVLTVKDFAGNVMRQTISPAFRVGELAGVESVERDADVATAGVTIADGILTVDDADAAAATTVYDMHGRCRYSAEGSSHNLRMLPRGLYLVRTASGAFRISL